MGSRPSPLFIVLAVLNGLNAAYPAVLSVDLLRSPLPLENRWGVLVGLAAAGMLGLAVCLLVRPNRSWVAASVAVVLLLVHAAMLLPLAASDTQGMGGGMLAFFGAIGTGLFGIVPVATLLLTRGTGAAPRKGDAEEGQRVV